ncbi:hypothetical protein ABHF33_05270 [Chitinibacter sp. FCG-7]|uniref:DUF2497 domain-containing protein n=1 Tax=Chitinibacter mangrovi TaxID=3153927 RepID=A0AAU7FCB1_9NEIS
MPQPTHPGAIEIVADQKQTPNNDSVNPLFNKMDALMARHRNGPAASLDDIPVLTEVAPKTIPSLFDVVDDIPSLTDVVEPNLADKIASLELEWGIDHQDGDIAQLEAEPAAVSRKPQALMIDPLPFQAAPAKSRDETPTVQPAVAPQPAAIPLLPGAAKPPQSGAKPKPEPVFLDLPMLDLEALKQEHNPDLIELPTLPSTTRRDLVSSSEHQFLASDLVLPLELLPEATPADTDFTQALAEASLAAAEVPHLDLDAILSLNSTEQVEPTESIAEPDSTPASAAIADSSADEASGTPEPSDAEPVAEQAAPAQALALPDPEDAAPEDADQHDAGNFAAVVAESTLGTPAPNAEPARLEADHIEANLQARLDEQVDENPASNPEDEELQYIDLHLSDDDDAPEADLFDAPALRVGEPQDLQSTPYPARRHSDEPTTDELIVYGRHDESLPIVIDLDADEAEWQTVTDEIVLPAALTDSAVPPEEWPDTVPAQADTDTDTDTEAGIAAEVMNDEPQEAIPQELDQNAVAEITAIVGAQLAIDIASEVEQLTKQHFSALMNQLYGETLRKLTEEISRDLEAHLAPRIAELVEAELRSKGLL